MNQERIKIWLRRYAGIITGAAMLLGSLVIAPAINGLLREEEIITQLVLAVTIGGIIQILGWEKVYKLRGPSILSFLMMSSILVGSDVNSGNIKTMVMNAAPFTTMVLIFRSEIMRTDKSKD